MFSLKLFFFSVNLICANKLLKWTNIAAVRPNGERWPNSTIQQAVLNFPHYLVAILSERSVMFWQQHVRYAFRRSQSCTPLKFRHGWN